MLAEKENPSEHLLMPARLLQLVVTVLHSSLGSVKKRRSRNVETCMFCRNASLPPSEPGFGLAPGHYLQSLGHLLKI